jgi:hypothetical protein
MTQKRAGHGGPRRGAGRPPKAQPTDSIRVDEDVADMATFVAKRRKMDVADLVSAELRRFIMPLFKEEHAKLLAQSPARPSE